MAMATITPAEPVTKTPAPTATRRPLRDLLPRDARAVVVGLVSLALAAGSFASFGLTGHALLGAVLCPVLVLLAVIDYDHHLLPNDIVFPAILAVGLIVAAANPGGFVTHLVAAAALGFFFLLFAVVFKGGLGMGDVKLGFLIGLALGWQTMSATLIALAGLFVVALWILAREGLESRRKAIPFGPFLAIGAVLTYFLS